MDSSTTKKGGKSEIGSFVMTTPDGGHRVVCGLYIEQWSYTIWREHGSVENKNKLVE